MIKSIIIRLAKRYAVATVQEAITAKKGEVAMWSKRVGLWVARVRLVVAFLERLSERLADGELTNEEADRTTQELKILADEVTR